MSYRYFYDFLEPISAELSRTLQELENAIYSSPRSMLTHSRTLIGVLLETIMIRENIPNQNLTINERIHILDENGLLPYEIKNAFHVVRRLGNMAAHDTRQFRFSESLTAWENIYVIVKWFVEVYESYEIEFPEYVDPKMRMDHTYGLEEMVLRFKKIEELLKQSLEKEEPRTIKEKSPQPESKEEISIETKSKDISDPVMDEEPGLMTIRTIRYGDDSVDVPYFLRDAFLLPQRFPESEQFLFRLGKEQQARLMSELPNSLEGFHKRITHCNETHSKTFFMELKEFIAEEIRRRKLAQKRPGELFLFYGSDEIVVTEDLGNIDINNENFVGIPRLIQQLNEDGIYKVRDLPKELLILAKYKSVGKGKVASFFNQLKEIQNRMMEEIMQ